MKEYFKNTKISLELSSEEYTGMYNKILLTQIETLYNLVNKDKVLNLGYKEYFTISYYKDIFNQIETGINKYFNLNLKIVPNEELAIYIDSDDKELNTAIKKVMKGDIVKYETLAKYINKRKLTKRGNKLKDTIDVYIGININQEIFINKKTPEELTKDILNTIDSIFEIGNDNNEIIDLMNNVLSAIKEGKDTTYIYTEVLYGNLNDIENISDYKRIVKIGEKFVEHATENNNNNNKLNILVRINYLILLVTVLIVIYTALAVPMLGYSIATLIVYNIFLYIYKLVVKVLTGNKDPLDESFKQTTIEGIGSKNTVIKDILQKDSVTILIKHLFNNSSDSLKTIKNKIYNTIKDI